MGWTLALLVVWLLDTAVDDLARRNYGIIVSAFLALLGATLAATISLSNIDNQNRIAENKNAAALVVARALLSIHLSSLFKICKRGVEISLQYKVAGSTSAQLKEELEIRPETLKSIADTIRVADPSDADRLANIIKHYQVIFARSERITVPNNNHLAEQSERAVDWGLLSRLVTDCFDYAREPDKTIPQKASISELSTFMNGTMSHVPKPKLVHTLVQARMKRTNPEIF